jgi:peptidoglycan/LPS O-acetylase OafA/YrhL
MENTHTKKYLGYIPALDGLRAFAIILVMMAHSNFRLFGNGGIGVTLFFALSGFLITTLLLEEFDKNNDISFKAFYVRRTFRLFPALYTVLFFVFIYSFFFNYKVFPTVFPEIIASGLYVYNISWLWNVKPLLLYHNWSLGVEEQFYVLWPITLYVFMKNKALKLASYLLIALILFFWFTKLLCVFNGTFFVFVSSIIDESIFLGCLLAIVRWKGKLNFSITKFWPLFCLISIILVGVFSNANLGLYNPLLHKIVSVFACVIILYLVNEPNGFIQNIFSNKVLVFIGKISYSLYLWHLPVFRIFALHSTLNPRVSFIAKILVSFCFALLSWYLVEKISTNYGRSLSKKIVK